MSMRLIRLLKQDLAREVDEWATDEIISEGQRDRILERYGITDGQGSPLGYQILIILGFFFIGLSLITLIGANWDDIPRYIRTFGLIALTTVTHLVGWYYFRRNEQNRAMGFFFLGNLFYGASIILIAQIFHLGEHMPDGVYLWALGCLAMAVTTRNPLIAAQMLALGGMWLILEAELGFLPVTFPIFVVASIYVLMHAGSIWLFLGSVAGTAFWIECVAAFFWSSGRKLNFDVEHIVLTLSLFAFAYGLSQWLMSRNHSELKDYGTVLGAWCLRFIIVVLLVFTFEEPWAALIEADWHHLPSLSVVSLVLWAGAIYAGYRAGYYRSLVVFAAIFLLTIPALYFVNESVHALAFQFAYNLVMVGLGIWLVIRGIRTRTSHYFWSGIVSIVLVALIRYFDLIGNYIGGSILFMFVAIILLGAARYWRALEVRGDG